MLFEEMRNAEFYKGDTLQQKYNEVLTEISLKPSTAQTYISETERITIQNEDISANDYLCPSMTG